MRIITARQQGEALIRLTKLNDALMSDDAIKRMDAMGHTAELAYTIGGLRLMNMVKTESFGEDGENRMSDLIRRQDAIDAVQDHFSADGFKGYDDGQQMMDRIKALPSAEPPVLTCDGCRHAGTYDTDFPCSGCIRREKDYYEQER